MWNYYLGNFLQQKIWLQYTPSAIGHNLDIVLMLYVLQGGLVWLTND